MESEALRQGASFEGLQPGKRMDRNLVDRVRILVGDGLDLHAAFGTGDQRVHSVAPV